MAAIASIAGLVISLAGSIMSSQSASAAGRAGQAQKEYEAKIQEQQAGQEIAASQRNALEEKRKGDLVASRALALAAASGGGVSDPTVMHIIADLDGESAYRQAYELYRGEENARRLRIGAALSRYEGEVIRRGGQAQARAYQYQAVGGLLTNGSSLYQRYSTPASGTRLNE